MSRTHHNIITSCHVKMILAFRRIVLNFPIHTRGVLWGAGYGIIRPRFFLCLHPLSRRTSGMSLHPHVIVPVPEETARVARAAFPKGHPSLTFRDARGTLFQDEDFSALFPVRGQPGSPPWRLALVTIMQCRENL